MRWSVASRGDDRRARESRALRLDAGIVLTADEEVANRRLMAPRQAALVANSSKWDKLLS